MQGRSLFSRGAATVNSLGRKPQEPSSNNSKPRRGDRKPRTGFFRPFGAGNTCVHLPWGSRPRLLTFAPPGLKALSAVFLLCASVPLWLVNPAIAQESEAPLVGRPKDFSGLVGQYSLSVSASATEVRVEEPLTLTVRISALTAESAPPERRQLQLLPETFAEDFYVEDLDSTFKKERAWEFTYRLRPKHAGVTMLPSLKLVYYHPQRQKYQATYSEAIELKVRPRTEAASKQPAEAPAFLFELPSEAELLEQVRPPLVANRLVPFVIFVGLPVLCFFWYLAWRLLNPAVVRQRRHPSSPIGARALAELRKQAAGFDTAMTLFADYLRERTGLRSGFPTAHEVDVHLRRIGVSRDLRRRYAEFFEERDAMLFAPQRSEKIALKETAIQLVLALEAEPCLGRF